MSFNNFSKHEKGKNVTKINISNNFKHLSQNNHTNVMISQNEIFHFHSKEIKLLKIISLFTILILYPKVLSSVKFWIL